MIKDKDYLKYSEKQSKKIQQCLVRELAAYNPKYFLTVQLPRNWRQCNLCAAHNGLKLVMKHFQRQLLGPRWNKKTLPFFSIAERNTDGSGWHFHILIYDCRFNIRALQTALNKTVKTMKLTQETFDLKRIRKTPHRAYLYCVKTIRADSKGHYDSGVITTAEALFNISKTKRKAAHTARLFKRFTLLPLFAGFLYLRLSLFPLRPRPATYPFGDIGCIPLPQYQHW